MLWLKYRSTTVIRVTQIVYLYLHKDMYIYSTQKKSQLGYIFYWCLWFYLWVDRSSGRLTDLPKDYAVNCWPTPDWNSVHFHGSRSSTLHTAWFSSFSRRLGGALRILIFPLPMTPMWPRLNAAAIILQAKKDYTYRQQVCLFSLKVICGQDMLSLQNFQDTYQSGVLEARSQTWVSDRGILKS